MDNLTVSASILDLGFISWTKGATKIASANPESINMKELAMSMVLMRTIFLILLLRFRTILLSYRLMLTDI